MLMDMGTFCQAEYASTLHIVKLKQLLTFVQGGGNDEPDGLFEGFSARVNVLIPYSQSDPLEGFML